jgi:hypothetical protein
MFNEEDILSDEELLKITGGGRFTSTINVISERYNIILKYGIQPLYGIKTIYGIKPTTTI